MQKKRVELLANHAQRERRPTYRRNELIARGERYPFHRTVPQGGTEAHARDRLKAVGSVYSTLY